MMNDRKSGDSVFISTSRKHMNVALFSLLRMADLRRAERKSPGFMRKPGLRSC